MNHSAGSDSPSTLSWDELLSDLEMDSDWGVWQECFHDTVNRECQGPSPPPESAPVVQTFQRRCRACNQAFASTGPHRCSACLAVALRCGSCQTFLQDSRFTVSWKPLRSVASAEFIASRCKTCVQRGVGARPIQRRTFRKNCLLCGQLFATRSSHTCLCGYCRETKPVLPCARCRLPYDRSEYVDVGSDWRRATCRTCRMEVRQAPTKKVGAGKRQKVGDAPLAADA